MKTERNLNSVFIQGIPDKVLDVDSSSLSSPSASPQGMASPTRLGNAVCANCREEIVDKYLLKVHKDTDLLSDFFSAKILSVPLVARLVSCQSLSSLTDFARVK